MAAKKAKKKVQIFPIVNTIIMILFVIITLYPVLNTLAISLNDGTDSLRGGIYLLPRKFTLTTSFSHKSEKRTEHSCFSFLEYSMRLSCILCLCTLLHFIIYKLCHFCGTAYKKGRFKFYSFTPPSVSPVTKYFCKNG